MKLILTIFSILTSIFFNHAALAIELTAPNFDEMRKIGIGKVSEVVNPLTIKLEDGRFIQLAGLDYPDLDFYDSGDLSITANKILDDFLKNKKIIIYQTKSKDHGRVNRMGYHIAHIVRADSETWVQGMMLSLGVARVRTSKYNSEMATEMLASEKRARHDKLGLWGMDQYKILSPYEAEKHIGSYQIVEGKVNNASMHKNKLYLNFGNNWREDFTIAISAFDLRNFTKKKIDPQKWNGKLLRVRGWVESYNGPYMEIDHPERFEALFEQNNKDTKEEEEEEEDPQPKKMHKTRKGSALPVVPTVND